MATIDERVQCPHCGGAGETGPILACGPGGSRWIETEPCRLCKGEKTIGGEQAERMALGERVRAERRRLRITQRRMAAIIGVDVIAYSRAELQGQGIALTFDRMRGWLDADATDAGGEG